MPVPPWIRTDHAWALRDRDWEASVVERIRRGEKAPHSLSVDEFIVSDHPWTAMGWDQVEMHAANANRLHSAYLTDAQIEKRRARQKILRQAVKDEVARRAAAAAAAYEANRAAERIREARWAKEREEQERANAEWLELLKKREDERKARDIDWEVERARVEEARKIRTSKWLCNICGGESRIRDENRGFRITCNSCGKTAWGSHEALAKVLK